MTDENSWRTPAFRQSVVAKVDEAIRQSGMNTSRNSLEMENHVFQKAKTKEEYLGFVARLILHVREMKPKQGTGMSGPAQNPGGQGMQDPINALQNLASQGSRNPMMNMGPQPGQMGGPQQAPASNLLQTLNRGPSQQMMMGNMGGNMSGPLMQDRSNMGNMGNMGNAGAMNASQMSSQMANQMRVQQMQSGVMNQMPSHMGSPLQAPIQSQMGGQMGSQMQGPMQMGGGMPNQMQNQMMGAMSQMQQQKPMMMNQMNQNFPRQVTPSQMYQPATSQSVQSPAGMGGQQQQQQQPIASPVLAPSPGVLQGGPPRSVGMAPSPGGSLNTPGQPGQSPGGANITDEQAYMEKVRHLRKYIDPLRKMITKMGNEDVEKLSKMKKLLEILSNPQQRMPLDTLIKCEIVLEKIDFRRGDGSVAPPTATFKEPHAFNALLEAITSNLSSPVFNHTLHRTFGPTMDTLFGPEIDLVPPLKKVKVEEPPGEIPDVLQGEIARLDQRFKVSLDSNQQPGSKTIQLICCLDDKHLPCVPPISVSVPEGYPKVSPTVHTGAHEYTATKFLSNVQKALDDRVKMLPKFFTVSQLLDTWEMSVRQACSGNTKASDPFSMLRL